MLPSELQRKLAKSNDTFERFDELFRNNYRDYQPPQKRSKQDNILEYSMFKDAAVQHMCAVRKIIEAPVASVIPRSDDVQLAPKKIIQTLQIPKAASNSTVKHRPVSGSSHLLNTYNETYSNSLLTRVSSESISSNASSPKVSLVSTISTSNGSFGQIKALRPDFQATQPRVTNSIVKSDGSTMTLGNKQNQSNRTASMTQLKTVNIQGASSIVIKAQPKPVDVIAKALKPDFHATQPCTTNSIVKSDGSTMTLGNKQNQSNRTAPITQLKTVNTQGASSIVIKAQPKPVDVIARALRPDFQATKPRTTNSIVKSDSSTITLGNKRNQSIRTAPIIQLKTVNIQGASSIMMKAQPKPVDVIARVLRPDFQATKPLTTNSIAKSDDNTIIVGNKQNQSIRTAPITQLKTLNTQEACSIVIKAQPKPVDIIARCNAKDCKNMASMWCSLCLKAKYCHSECQKKDWYERHIKDCDRKY